MKRFSLALSALVLISCADQQSSLNKLNGQIAKGQFREQLSLSTPGQLTVVDERNTPVPNANVLIGQSPGNPFPGNSLTTDASGQIHMPDNFKSEMPMTIQAEGYITQTYLHFSPTATIAQLRKKEGAKQIEVKGNTTNFTGVVNGDGKIDFGLVIPSMTKSQLLAFDLSTVLSPESDPISIAGRDIQIPSNITLPEQSETYIIIPVSLNKPQYRSYVRDPGSHHFTGVHGWFPMKQVVDAIRGGKSFFEVINYFQFTSVGGRDIGADDAVASQDINVNQSPMDTSINIRAPAFDASKVMLSLALANNNGQLAVTDLKRLNPNQAMTLKGSSQLGTRGVLSALMNSSSVNSVIEDVGANDLIALDRSLNHMFSLTPSVDASPNFRQLSFVFQNQGEGAPTFMPLVAAPQLSNGVLQLQAPSLPAGLRVLGTYIVYSDILPGNGGSVKSETRTRLWELWQDGWVNTVNLPAVTFDKVAGHTYRWEVLYLATNNPNVDMTSDGSVFNVDAITHVSRNAVNVQ